MSLVYTVGHSSHPYETFLGLLMGHDIEVLVDTRSSPYSKFVPHFDREMLQRSLALTSIKYLFLGEELGGKPKGDHFYDATGRVLYGRRTADIVFQTGIERLERGMAQFRVALMCGEEDPAHCHRRLMIGRVLVERGHQLLHIRADGRLEEDSQVEKASNKPMLQKQPALFAELEEDRWRSTASVSPKKAPASSSAH
jgi:uncharacterized protein (DUF488 family)